VAIGGFKPKWGDFDQARRSANCYAPSIVRIGEMAIDLVRCLGGLLDQRTHAATEHDRQQSFICGDACQIRSQRGLIASHDQLAERFLHRTREHAGSQRDVITEPAIEQSVRRRHRDVSHQCDGDEQRYAEARQD